MRGSKTNNTRTTREQSSRNTNAKNRYKDDRRYEKIGQDSNKRREAYKKDSRKTKSTKHKEQKHKAKPPSQNVNRPKRTPKRKQPIIKTVATEGSIDYIMLSIIYILVFFGILMIYSASNYSARVETGDPFIFVRKQAMVVILGLVVMHFFANNKVITYTDLKKFNLPTIIYLVGVFLLFITMFIGVELNGQKRWLAVPVFGTFQPSELMKHALIIFMADVISRHRNKMENFKFYVTLIILVLIPTILTATADLSTAVTIFLIGVGIIFVASPYFWRFILVAIGGVMVAIPAIYLYFTLGDGFRLARIEAWKDPFAYSQKTGFQTVQSLLAIGSGGLFGLGIGKGRQKLFYIPEGHNDIIFAIICEELGFIGASMLIIIFILLFWRGTKIAVNAKEIFGCLIASGVTIMLAVQTIINISVTTNTIPNTGIGLPFISYGGTSILFLLAMMGILLNISKYRLHEG